MKASAATWPVSADAAERNRRSVYVFVKRNLRYPLFAAFDAPDRNETCSRRFDDDHRPAGADAAQRASSMPSGRSSSPTGSATTSATTATRSSNGRTSWHSTRPPTSEERSAAERFLETQSKKSAPNAALADFCHALLNLNEFVYVD